MGDVIWALGRYCCWWDVEISVIQGVCGIAEYACVCSGAVGGVATGGAVMAATNDPNGAVRRDRFVWG